MRSSIVILAGIIVRRGINCHISGPKLTTSWQGFERNFT